MNNLKTVVLGFVGAAIMTVMVHIVGMALADQSERVVPTSGIFTGPEYAAKIGDMARSISTLNKGSTAPANVGGSAVDGLDWIDDSGSLWIKKRYVNGGWVIEGFFDPTNGLFIPVTGGGIGTLNAGSTVDLGSLPQKSILVTGSATISSFGSSALEGIEKTIRFDNASVLTPSNSLLVPGGFPLTTASGDRALVTHLGSGNWEITTYTRANGIPIDGSAVGKADFTFATSVSPVHVPGMGQKLLRTSYPAYLAAATRVQDGSRTSGSTLISTVADTTGLGAGMPVEGTGIQPGCTIASVSINAIILNSSSCVTSTGRSSVTVFVHGYGSGGDGTTVGVEDCRTRVLAGRDRNDPGSFAGLLTTGYFGANAALFGAKGGLENWTMSTTNLPPYTPQGSVAFTASTDATKLSGDSGAGFSSGGHFPSVSGASVTIGTITFTGTAQGGNSTPIRTVQPTLMADCNVRVIP